MNMSNKQKELEKKYQFQTEYIKNVKDFKSLLKKLIPYKLNFKHHQRKKYVG